MKAMLIIPITVLGALAAAAGMCVLAGVQPHGRDLLLAAIVAIAAAEVGLAPMLLLRSTEPTTRAQVALGGTVAHMLITILLAAAVMVGRVVEPATPFVLWLIGAYWISLALLVKTLIVVLSRTAVGGEAKQQGL